MRYNKLWVLDLYTKSLAFICREHIETSIDDIFSTFRHFGLEALHLESIKRILLDIVKTKRAERRADVRERAAELKKELAEYVYYPDRIWRLSQRAGLMSWEYLEFF
jgi:hypothetical protein